MNTLAFAQSNMGSERTVSRCGVTQSDLGLLDGLNRRHQTSTKDDCEVLA